MRYYLMMADLVFHKTGPAYSMY